MKILITDCQLRSSVALIRYFGKQGFFIIAADKDRISTGFYSKYTREKFVYPDITKSEKCFIEQLSAFVKKENVDIVFPISNESILAIAKHRNHFDKSVSIPIADYDTLIQAVNKARTFRKAEELEIPIPKTYYPIRYSELEQIDNFPVILKPTISSGSRGLTICNNKSELKNSFYKNISLNGDLIVQEYIPINEDNGGEYCWYAIYDWNGECKGYGCYKTIRSYPIGTGPSTVQESVEIEKVNEISFKLMKGFNRKGLVQIDYRIDARDEIPKLIEINGRSWAPLTHSMQAGLNVPRIWLDLALKKPIPKQPPIKLHVKTRWLLPADILWFLSSKKNKKNIKEFFQFKNINFDLLQKADLKPIFGFFLASITYLFNKDKRQLIIRNNRR